MKFLQNKTIKFILVTIIYNLILFFDICAFKFIIQDIEMTKFTTRLVYTFFAGNKLLLIKAGQVIYKVIFELKETKNENNS